MYLIVWLDCLILENFIINYFLIFITSQTIRQNLNNKRLFIASALSSLYVITLLYRKLRLFSLLPFKLIVALGIIIFCFKFNSLLLYIKTFCIYVLYSMLLAGVSFFLQCESNSSLYGFMDMKRFPIKKLSLSIILLYLFINRVVIYIKDRREVSNLIYSIEISVDNKEKKIEGFLDTGNELKEPATGLPVIIVERNIFRDTNLNKYDKYFIPYKTVSTSSSKLEGFIPDEISICNNNNIEHIEAIIGLCDSKLSDHNDYQALLCRGLFK